VFKSLLRECDTHRRETFPPSFVLVRGIRSFSRWDWFTPITGQVLTRIASPGRIVSPCIRKRDSATSFQAPFAQGHSWLRVASSRWVPGSVSLIAKLKFAPWPMRLAAPGFTSALPIASTTPAIVRFACWKRVCRKGLRSDPRICASLWMAGKSRHSVSTMRIAD
jgi:hypothetical protein